MKVWIVEHHHDYEGFSIEGVYADEAKARAIAADHNERRNLSWSNPRHIYADSIEVSEHDVTP